MIGARYDGDREREEPIELTAGELRELNMQAPPMRTQPSQDVATPALSPTQAALAPARPATAAHEELRLPSAVFWTAAGLTVTAAAFSLWSGLDMLDKHDTYVQRPTRSTYDSGKAAETRTNVLLGTTAALLSATAALFFFTAWNDDEETLSPSLAATPESAVLSLRRRFQ